MHFKLLNNSFFERLPSSYKRQINNRVNYYLDLNRKKL